MKYFEAQSIYNDLISNHLFTVFFVPVLKLYLREYLTVFPIQGFAKKAVIQTKDEVSMIPKLAPLFLLNLFYLTSLVIYTLCISSVSLATDFSWGKFRSNQQFASYDEACEFQRAGLEKYWKNQCPTPQSCTAVITFLAPKRPGVCMGPGSFDESGPRNYSCGGPWTTLYSRHRPNGSNFGSCYTVYRQGEECNPPKVLNPENGSCQLPEDNPKNPTGGCSTVGNPINLLSGNKSLDQIDYARKGVSPLYFSRHYNSKKNYLYQTTFGVARRTRNPMGMGWYHNYYQGLTILTAAKIKLTRADGQAFLFKLTNGLWSPDADVDYQLEEIRRSHTPSGWKVLTPTGTTETYNSTGDLLSITSRQGISQHLAYRSGLLVKVTDSFGRALTFSYNTANKLVSLTDPNHHITRYEYDDLNNLTTVIYPDKTPSNLADNPRRKYRYGELTHTANVNQAHALTGIFDENNQRFATYQYNAIGQAISTEHAMGGINKYSLSYQPEDQSTQITDPLGTVYTTHYTPVLGILKKTGTDQPAGSGCEASASAISYDEKGNVAASTDFNGIVTEYSYDLDRNLETRRIEAIDTPAQRTITTVWHPELRLPVQIEVLDSLNNALKRTSFSYDTAGLLLTRTETDVASNASRTTAYTYNTLGLLATIDGPRVDTPDITRFEYDVQGNLVKIINTLGQETLLSDYDASGRVQTITDPNGLLTSLTYHPRGWISSSTVAGNTTTFDYDKVGQLIKLTRPDTTFTLYTYDPAHRLTDITDNLGNTIHYTLDTLGNRLNEEITDASGHITRVLKGEYDQLSRLLLAIGGENQTQHFQYDANGNRTSQTDARNTPRLTTPADRAATKTLDPLNLHNTLSSTYDALNRLIESIHRQQRESDRDDIRSDFEYNALDQLVSVTDPNGLETVYNYNALGDLLIRNSPDTGITRFVYDQAGNRVSQTDARNITVNSSYDALNRLISIRYPDNRLNVSYLYDENNNRQNGSGRLTTLSDASGTTHYRYDKRGNLTEASTRQGLVVLRTLYAYNEVDQVIQITYPSGRSVDYRYDRVGRIVEVSTTDALGSRKTLLSNIEYQPFGPLSAMSYGNGLTAQHRFDQDYRQREIFTPPVLERNYVYDQANNITQIIHGLDHAFDQTFYYDGLSRLVRAHDTDDYQRYQYDAAGNRIQAETTQLVVETLHSLDDYHYFIDSHQLDQINDGNPYRYDANGNTTHLPNNTIFTDLVYDQQNRLAQVNGITYTYNGKGERVRKTHASGRMTGYHYDQQGLLIAETDASGHSLKDYIYLYDRLIALVTNPTTTPPRSPAPILEEISLNHRWKTFSYPDAGHIPLFFAGVPSYHDLQPGVIRLKKVTETTAKIAFKEWNYLDGKHLSEQVSLLRLKPGRHTMPDGSLWEIGTFTLNGTKKWRQQTFGQIFPEPPKVFLTAQTANDRDTVTVRAKAITNNSFKAALFEQEKTYCPAHVNETIAYLAIYSPTGKGTVNLQGTELPYQLVTRQLNHQFKPVANHAIKLEEEQSKDEELYHSEIVAVLNLNGHLFAQDNSSYRMDTVAIRRNSATPRQAQAQQQQIQDSPQQPAVFFVHNDHLKTPQVITDEEQNIVWQASYDPFGKAIVTTELIENNIRFPGQYYDLETDLHYNYQRYYDPTIGRYITSDPIGLSGGLNTYAYVGGNPLKYSDPKGLFFWDVLDLGFFAQSLYEYSQCSNNENAINLGLDAIGLLPGIPALGTLRRIDEAVDAAKKPPIIIGENMKRVKEYADKTGGLSYQPWKNDLFDYNLAKKRNKRWIQDQRRQGRNIIDIGPDFQRRIATGRSSPFYELERQHLKGYKNRQQVFERSVNNNGVPGLDF